MGKIGKFLIEAVKAWGRPYNIEEGEAAFYGPKIDIMTKDSIGRTWQLSTVQLDFNQPENFDMQYTDEKGLKARPAVLHVAILGSTERFMGILIEHFAGAFPFWLAPVQTVVLPVSDKFSGYGKSVHDALVAHGIRSELGDANESLGKRIRFAEIMKVPYVIVVGEKEETAGTVNFRTRGSEEKSNEMKLDQFDRKITEGVRRKKAIEPVLVPMIVCTKNSRTSGSFLCEPGKQNPFPENMKFPLKQSSLLGRPSQKRTLFFSLGK